MVRVIVTLKRTIQNADGTKGILTVLNKQFYTIERPWLDNAKRVSCIPAGTYKCAMVNSPRFGKVYGVHDVKDRSHILIHAGNTPDDTNGCILIGKTTTGSSMFVGNSRSALAEFITLLRGEPFTLIVEDKA